MVLALDVGIARLTNERMVRCNKHEAALRHLVDALVGQVVRGILILR